MLEDWAVNLFACQVFISRIQRFPVPPLHEKFFVLEKIAWQVRYSIKIMQQVPSIFGDKTLESIRNTLFKFR